MNKRKKRGNKYLVMVVILAVVLAFFVLVLVFKEDISFSPSQPTGVKINVGNAIPTIVDLQPIPNVNLNPSPSTTSVTVTFTARDSNGASDLVDETALAEFTNAGEQTRTGTCSVQSQTQKEKTYQCAVLMDYFDKSGGWAVNVKVNDTKLVSATSSSTFIVNLLRDISLSSAIINFPSAAPGDFNIISTEQTVITNNGNFEAPPGAIIVTSYDLVGEVDSIQNIPAANFKAAGASQADVCGQGDSLIHSSPKPIATSSLSRGPTGNTETLSYCLTSVPDISSQTYSAIGGNAWVIAIN